MTNTSTAMKQAKSGLLGTFLSFAVALTSTIVLISAPANAESPDTGIWQKLLTDHVDINGGVSYLGFEKNEMKLDAFLTSYDGVNPATMSDNKRKAAYINLYNALMIKNILRHAKSKKIKVNSPDFLALKINKISIPGGNIWNGDYKISIAGENVNLDNIEHQLIRGVDAGKLKKLQVSKLDPRIHTAVNCAALSCPRVREIAYTEKNVDQLLDENIREYISSDNHFSLLSDTKLKSNSIVFWYYSDFDDHAQKVLKIAGAGSYLTKFLDPKTKDFAKKKKILESDFNDRSQFSLKLSSAFSFDYNWLINDRRNLKKAAN